MAEGRKRLCFNCDEQYVRGHRCQRLVYIEVDDYADDGTMDADSNNPDSTNGLCTR